MCDILPQDSYFYSDTFPKSHAQFIISSVSKASIFGTWNRPNIIGQALIDAKQQLKDEFNVVYIISDLLDAMDKLHARHKVFQKMRNTDGAKWDKITNKFMAPDDVWAKWFEEDDNTKWYAIQGEPEYGDLEVIFATGKQVVDNTLSSPHKLVTNLDDYVVPKHLLNRTPSTARIFINLVDSPYKCDSPYERFADSPLPLPSPGAGVLEISAETFKLSAEKKKAMKKLFQPPSSPTSSTGGN